jgi:hypothetical protein
MTRKRRYRRPRLKQHATHPFHKPKPPRPLVETKFKCRKCACVWTVEFASPIRETAYKQKRMGFRCNDCGFGWASHEVLGPEPEIAPSPAATLTQSAAAALTLLLAREVFDDRTIVQTGA